MKLVELLVKHITEWPKCVNYFVQDYDGEVKTGAGELPVRRDAVWIRPVSIDKFSFGGHTCSDWDTAIVTESMWRTEKYKSGHCHAHLMLQYAEDATTTDKPWNLWEVCFGSRWVPLKTHPEWAQAAQYRRKTLPDLEVDARVLVWNLPQNKVKRHFSHFDEDGCICVFDHGMSSFTAKGYTACPHWELWEDE